MENILYLVLLLFFCYLNYRIMRAFNIESYFKKGRILEIRLAYIFIILILSDLLASLVIKLMTLF